MATLTHGTTEAGSFFGDQAERDRAKTKFLDINTIIAIESPLSDLLS